jgi:pimeloyl-ACP methyl ester carboxylesterase
LFSFWITTVWKESCSLVTMGGKTAMQVALRFPERISCLIVVGIAPVQYEHFQKILKLIRAM